MKNRILLFIDDEPDYDQIEILQSDLQSEGIYIHCEIFNPKERKYFDEDLNQIQDIFYKDLKKYLKGNHVQVIACDYTLGEIDGIELLGKIKNEWNIHKTTNLIFSTKIEAILNEIIGVSSQLNDSEKVEKLKKLIKTNSIDFPPRTALFGRLRDIFRNYNLSEIDIKIELLQWLRTFESHTFQGHPLLERKTLGIVADAIENETNLGVDFQKLFVEQGISSIIQLNNLPPNE
jgi:CheY-like chemotaxis protein